MKLKQFKLQFIQKVIAEIMVKDEADEVIKGSFDSLKIDIQIILNQ